MSPRIIAALLIALSSTSALAQTQTVEPKSVPVLAENAPDRHVVVPGDTLWSIAAKFLQDPSRWAEVWKLNPADIKNPHRIYPGQVIVLNRSGSTPQLSLVEEKLQPRVFETNTHEAIPAIPQQSIEPFLSRPLLLDEAALESTPRIVAVQDGRVLAGIGDQIYAKNLVIDKTIRGTRDFHIYRPGRALVDPETKAVLGREALIVGSARLTELGEPATLVITGTQTEVNRGDRLMPRTKPEILNYPQHRPEKPIAARVISLAEDARTAGRLSTLIISKGGRDGLEVGHVLALYRPGLAITDRYKDEVTKMSTPEERFGLVYVFKVFDKVSYGLIMQAERPVSPGDQLRNP